MNKILMVLVFGLVLAITAQPTINAAEEKGKIQCGPSMLFSVGSIYSQISLPYK